MYTNIKNTLRTARVIILLGLFALMPAYQAGAMPAAAQNDALSSPATINEYQTLTTSPPVEDRQLGGDIDISGDVAVVATLRDDAYVYRFDGTLWQEEAQLPLAAGRAVAIEGDTIVLGARYDDELGSNTGVAYVYEYDGSNWNQIAKLTASDAQAEEMFGMSVDIEGNISRPQSGG